MIAVHFFQEIVRHFRNLEESLCMLTHNDVCFKV